MNLNTETWTLSGRTVTAVIEDVYIGKIDHSAWQSDSGHVAEAWREYTVEAQIMTDLHGRDERVVIRLYSGLLDRAIAERMIQTVRAGKLRPSDCISDPLGVEEILEAENA